MTVAYVISALYFSLALSISHKYLREVLSDIQEFRAGGAKSKRQCTQFYQRLMALISLRATAR